MRQLVCAVIEFTKAQRLRFIGDGNGAGSSFNLLLKQLVNARLVGVRDFCIVPINEELPPSVFTQNIQVPNRRIRVFADAVQQRLELIQQRLNVSGLIDRRVVVNSKQIAAAGTLINEA